MNKIFRFYPGEKCPVCFSVVEILSDFDVPPGMAFDGETVMCTKCSAVGVFDGQSKGPNKIIWTRAPKVKDRSVKEIIFASIMLLIFIIVYWYSFF